MALKKFVKISRVSSLSDARYCAGMMVDILGFCLDRNKVDYVNPEEFKDITSWVSGIKKCGECEDMDAVTVKALLEKYELDYIEIKSYNRLNDFINLNIPVILYLNVSKDTLKDLENLVKEDRIEYLIIHCDDKKLESEIEETIRNASVKCIKDFDISPSSVSKLSPSWYGIQLTGTPEEQPGFKDYGVVMDVLEELETD